MSIGALNATLANDLTVQMVGNKLDRVAVPSYDFG